MLVLAIGGCTIAELQQRMTAAEYRRWVAFYRLFPFDDLHRYYRPAAVIGSALGGAPMSRLLDYLQPDVNAVEVVSPGNYSEADLKTFRALGAKIPSKR